LISYLGSEENWDSIIAYFTDPILSAIMSDEEKKEMNQIVSLMSTARAANTAVQAAEK